ncbi:hypothetical protein C819_02075 [Lachnospiraceae bacterium 10-1]|nr:hypothetical protein C819_02075 [Lachnospiraceae bacterium 10-1]
MKGEQSWLDRLDAKRDKIAEKLAHKEVSLPIELITGILFLLLGVVILLIMPKQVPVSDTDVINGRAFPTLLMVVMMIFSGIILLKELYNYFIKKCPLTTKKVNLLVEVKALEILAILFLTYLICKITDLFVIGAIFCCLGFLLYFRCRKKSYYAITLVTAVLIWVAFRFGLNVNF